MYSAVLYYWDHNEETAVTLYANGGSFSSVAALFATIVAIKMQPMTMFDNVKR